MKEHYHFVGIGGSGMGPLALLMLAKGCRVSGSDIKESPTVKILKDQGACITIGHNARNISEPNYVVYSSAISSENYEIIEAKRRNIPILRRAQLLAQLMNAQSGVAVAGAHGKTTTTSMVSHLFIQAGLKPTTAIGGIVNGASYNAAVGDGQYFVAEMDESDGSFLYFYPMHAIITNMDFEHVDYYHTWENIVQAYQCFMEQVSAQGQVVICGEDARLLKMAKEQGRTFLTYGFYPKCDIYANNIQLTYAVSSFDCYFKKEKIGRIELAIPGKHNILNAMACVGMGCSLGIDSDIIRESLGTYRGVQRRFQIKADVNAVMVVDDYGHHPTEIKAVIDTARLFPEKRLVVVFQPHRYTRTQSLMDEFARCLALADYVILTDIYAASEKMIEGVSSQRLFAKIEHNDPGKAIYLKKEDIVKHLEEAVRPGDLVIMLGAGDINQISDQFVDSLK